MHTFKHVTGLLRFCPIQMSFELCNILFQPIKRVQYATFHTQYQETHGYWNCCQGNQSKQQIHLKSYLFHGFKSDEQLVEICTKICSLSNVFYAGATQKILDISEL